MQPRRQDQKSASEEARIILKAIPPFDLLRTVAILRRRASHAVEIVEDGEYRRIANLGHADRLLSVRQVAPDQIMVRSLDGSLSHEEIRAASALLDRTLGLSVDLSRINSRVRKVPALADVAERFPGLKPPRFESLWVSLLSVIPFQQVSLDAGMAILNRVIRQCAKPHEVAGTLYYPYPTPEAIRDAPYDVLRACGLSRAKIAALQNGADIISAGVLNGEEIERLDDETALTRLVSLPGIGPWSAQLVLLRGFRRLAIFPAGDSGATRNLSALYGGTPAEIAARGASTLEQLGDVRGYLYFLLLAWRMWIASAPAS